MATNIFIQKPNKQVPTAKLYYYIDSSISKAHKFNCPFGVFQDNNGYLYTDALTRKNIDKFGRKGILSVAYPHNYI
jgi:hypothetical protein